MENVGQNIVSTASLPTPPPATIAASGHWNSGIFTSGGYPAIAAACTLSQNGTLTLQRYLDAAGTIPVGAAIEQNLTGGTGSYVAAPNDGVPFAALSIVIANTGGSTGNLTGVYILQSIQ